MTSEIEQYANFQHIRYAQCWEDADLLLHALDPQPGKTYLSIASGGENTLALLTRSPERVIAIDLSPAQIACLELKVAAYRTLTYEELLILMGDRPVPLSTNRDRLALYHRCRPYLSVAVQQFWDRHQPALRRGLAHAGKFERYLTYFRRYILPFIHPRHRIHTLLELRSPQERQQFYDQHWDTKRWRRVMRLFVSRFVMGRMGRDPSFFRYAVGSMADHILQRVRQVYITVDPQHNSYLQWILLGTHQTCLPLALRPEAFPLIQQNLNRLEWHCLALEDWLTLQPPQSIDGANLSNIFEYLSPQQSDRLFEALTAVTRSHARLVYWNMLTPRCCPDYLQSQMRSLPSTHLHQQDALWFYQAFHISERTKEPKNERSKPTDKRIPLTPDTHQLLQGAKPSPHQFPHQSLHQPIGDRRPQQHQPTTQPH